MLNADFLAMIRCPETRMPLVLADNRLIIALNDAIRANRLRNRSGQPVTEIIDGGLVRDDWKIVYPIVRDIPVLLVDEGIPLDQLAEDKATNGRTT